MQTKFKKADVAIVMLVLCAALLLFLLPLLHTKDTASVLIVSFSDGREQTYALDADTVLTLESNGHTLTVVIEGGTVRVDKSSCPDGICRSHAIENTGETLVCAPAGIALTVSGQGGDVDAIVG